MLHEPTGVILDITEFDLKTQAATVQDVMCKDVEFSKNCHEDGEGNDRTSYNS